MLGLEHSLLNPHSFPVRQDTYIFCYASVDIEAQRNCLIKDTWLGRGRTEDLTSYPPNFKVYSFFCNIYLFIHAFIHFFQLMVVELLWARMYCLLGLQ